MSSGLTYFVTGGNRGLGFAIVKQLAAANHKVIATTRDVAKSVELQKLADSNSNIHIVKLDLSSIESIEALDAQISKITDGVDIFISNAAISDSYYKVTDAPRDVWVNHYLTNALGPILVFQTLYKYLQKRPTKKVVFISTAAASITQYIPFPASAYAQSKAALNFSTKELSSELQPEGFVVIAVSPGLVSTDMGAYGFSQIKKLASPEVVDALEKVSVSPEDSSAGVLKLIDGLTEKDNGTFFNYTGEELAF
ncbi:uncharacterized protein RJT20DRAFT_127990 [Scheffersomyces xylosifermentans]|uniref:uncharacterized protein n=1 Tax=Scheffersomyces xylosifermentans TaxID=1304137 RepID=UPI00315DD964